MPLGGPDLLDSVIYFSHINKRTQYERPTVDHLSGPSSSKSYQGTSGAPPPRHQPAYSTSYHSNGHQPNGGHNGQAIYQHANGFSNGESGYGSGGGHPIPAPPANSSQVMFTRDPSKLRGELLTTRLVKGPKGLGFTLIGNDASSRGDEFIQIKSILPHGPAAADRTLHPGDVLVYVNNDCVLGASQSEACRIFLGIPIGDTVTLQVCRGYPLLLDPANRIVTENVYSQATNGQRSREVFDIDVIKGVDGFGFTIADGITGQRVRKILYPDQCPNLLEGDVILEMDGQNVRSMPHTQLVDKLRECSVGHRAHLVVKRASPRHRSRTPTAAFRYGESRQTPVAVAPRSKTPAPHNSNHSSSQQPTLQYQPRSLNALPPRNSDWAPPPARPSQPLPIVTSGYRPTVSTNTAPRPQGVDLYENVSRIRPSSTTLGFATPNYVPLSAFAQPEKPVGQEYITVNLIRKPSGFGFRLLGGVETNTFLTVGQIVQGGAAADDGRLREGDEIVEIDGRNVEGASHAEAVSILEHAAQAKHVKLVVRRARSEITRSSSLPATEQQRNGLAQVSSTYDVVLNREDNDGFGFIIISSINRNGSTIGQIMESSPAAKCGRLSVGDRVVAVNGIDILSLSHGEIVNLIKASGTSVRLTIGPPAAEREMSVDKPSPTRNITTTTTNIQTTFPASSSVPKTNGFTPASTYEPFVQPTPIPIQNGGSGINGGRSSTYGYASQDEHSTSQLITVELKRGERGFGFSIRGGQEFGAMPVFVLRIADDGPAAKDSRLRVGDQLVEINGRDTHGLTHQEAIDLIKQYPTVRLVVRRHQLRT